MPLRQCSKLGCSAVAVHRRGHCDSRLDGEADPQRIQKIIEILLLQYTDKKVDVGLSTQMPQIQLTDKLMGVTVFTQKSSDSPSPTENSRDASDSGSGNRQIGEHSSCATDSVDRSSGDTETGAGHPEDCRDTAGAVHAAAMHNNPLYRHSADQPERPEDWYLRYRSWMRW